MKLKNIKNIVLLGSAIAATAISCKKQNFDNIQPDLITTPTYDYKTILPASQTATATVIEGTSFKFLQNWMGYWARSGSYQDVTDEETYEFNNDFNVAVWNGLYANANNYNLVIKGAMAKQSGKYEAIARIMKALDFQMLVDVYGNVPYSQAFEGLNIKTPAYDKGKDIYDSLFLECDKAITILKDPFLTSDDQNFDIANNDLIFKGDATKWIRFANTLKLRMIIHAFQAPGFNPGDRAAAIVAEGSGFIGSGESAELNPGYSGSKPSPFYRAYDKTETGVGAAQGAIERGNAYAIGDGTDPGYYQWDGDPRMTKMYNTVGGNYKGIPYGQISGTVPGFTGDALSTISGSGYSPNGAASRAWIFTDFESLFLQAEARERGFLLAGPTASELYTSAVSASFTYLGLTGDVSQVTYPLPNPLPTPGSQAEVYLFGNATYPDVDYGATGGALFTILSQKWFALNGFNPLEVWTDWRRTDVVYGEAGGFAAGPPLSVNPNRDADKTIPIRLFYPQNEYNYNGASVGAEGTIDITPASTTATGRIFWDIN